MPILRWTLLGWLAVHALACCATNPRRIELEAERSPTVRVDEPAPPPEPWFPDNDSGDRLRAFVHAAWSFGDGAVERFEEALAGLEAGDPEEMLAQVTTAYAGLPPEHYTDRWLLVTTAGYLRADAAPAWLGEVAQSTLPEAPPYATAAGLDPRSEERVIRLGAVTALGNQLPESEEILLEIISTSELQSMQVAAIEAYLSPAFPRVTLVDPASVLKSPVYQARQSELRAAIPQERHHLLEVLEMAVAARAEG